jgi:hypothetical protein
MKKPPIIVTSIIAAATAATPGMAQQTPADEKQIASDIVMDSGELGMAGGKKLILRQLPSEGAQQMGQSNLSGAAEGAAGCFGLTLAVILGKDYFDRKRVQRYGQTPQNTGGGKGRA